ncbi:fungal-specific transcription factor domain-containing protein [Amylostereum chailletii]|nr:fungal-specific transcription factor domain-containing protein [Amylostereum chailletii]
MAKSNSSPDPAQQSSAVKRKKTDDDDDNLNGSKKARTRVSYSCGECHRRKQKCDRQMPCSHCLARKVPELCRAYTPGKPDQDVHLRLARLEHIIEIALPQYAQQSGFSSGSSKDRLGSSSPGEDDRAHSQLEDEDLVGGTFQSGRWYGSSASGSVAPGSMLEQARLSSAISGHNGHQRGSSLSIVRDDNTKTLVAANSIIDSVRQDAEPTPADNLKALIQDCGVPPHKITELVQELPPQRFSSVLIDFYFTAVNWTRYPISERDFRESYSSVCANGVSAHPSDVRFLPLLFVVLAIAVRLAPEHIAGDARSRRLTSLRYYWSSRRSLLIAAAIQPDSLDMVLTRLLSARFLTFDRRITECWSQLGAAVRTAQALGLHRDGGSMKMEPAQVEYRRRIWAYLYHADRSYALVLGRPNAIQDAYTSTHSPLNVEDEVTLAEIRNPPPLTTATRMTFVILRHTLAGIIGRIVHHYQQVRQHTHYSDVLAIDDDLLKFLHTLPPHFSLQPDTSLDEAYPYIPAHRYLLITEVLFVRISLHRPYLLRRLGTDRYLRSRDACFESATKDFEVRATFREKIPQTTLDSLSSAYREFQSAMISGIYLVLEPKGPLAGTMHAILDQFLQDHEGLREMDETTRREMKIIEFFKSKSSQMEASMGDSQMENLQGTSPSSPSEDTSDAQLLLGIQGSAPRMAAFTSLTVAPTSPALMHPETTSPLSNAVFPSPTIQRLQHGELGDGQNSSHSASPSADDESAAQNLLDHWYNAVSSGGVTNGPGLDGSYGVSAGLPWGGFGSSDLSGWFGPTPVTTVNTTISQGPTIDGSDWSYWETLVNEIRGGPTS